MSDSAAINLARQSRDELRGLWEVLSRQMTDQKLRNLPPDQQESFKRALEELLPKWDAAPVPVALTPAEHVEKLAVAARAGAVTKDQAAAMGRQLQEAGFEVTRTVTSPPPSPPVLTPKQHVEKLGEAVKSGNVTREQKENFGRQLQEYGFEVVRTVAGPSPPPPPPRELTLDEMVGRLVLLAGSGALSAAQKQELGHRFRVAGLETERDLDGPALVQRLSVVARQESSDSLKAEWAETLRTSGLSLRVKGEGGSWEVPREFSVAFGLSAHTDSSDISPTKVCLLAAVLAEALERIYEEAWQVWWDLPIEPPSGDIQVPDTARLRSRLKASLDTPPDRFKAALVTATRPSFLVVALLRASFQAAEQFSEDHYRQCTAKEIMQAAKREGVRDAGGWWKRFDDATGSWDKMKIADFFREAMIETVAKDSEGGHYLKELKEKYFIRARWPWGGF